MRKMPLLRHRRRFVMLMVVLAAIALVVGPGVTPTEPPPQPAEASENPVMQVTPPTARRPTKKARRPKIVLPTPIIAPADSYAPERVFWLGTIEIPRIGLVHDLYEGVTLHNIDHGPSHWPGTAGPGQLGNVVVAGHRVTHSHPFRNLDQLVPGDDVIFGVHGKRSVYKVTGTEVVTPDAVHIVEQKMGYTGTLFACHPPGSARFRIVVHLKLVNPGRRLPR